MPGKILECIIDQNMFALNVSKLMLQLLKLVMAVYFSIKLTMHMHVR